MGCGFPRPFFFEVTMVDPNGIIVKVLSCLRRRSIMKLLINALTGKVGPGTQVSGYPTYQARDSQWSEPELRDH